MDTFTKCPDPTKLKLNSSGTCKTVSILIFTAPRNVCQLLVKLQLFLSISVSIKSFVTKFSVGKRFNDDVYFCLSLGLIDS